MSEASPTYELLTNPNFPGQTYRSTYAFKANGSPSDDSVWYFTAEVAPPAIGYPKAARFFLLTPYLDQGLTVDDITTAIQTGWKMGGNSDGAELSYHKETKLLIVVGNNLQFDTVNGALAALREQKPKPAAAADSDKPAEATKTEK
jgi:hypothetical protein